MNICITRENNLYKSFKNSINYEEIIDKKFNLFDSIYDLPLVGLNYYFKADFRLKTELDYSKYDIIVFLHQGNDLSSIKSNKINIVNGVEIQPHVWPGNNDVEFHVPDNVDYFLNNFVDVCTYTKQVPFWYRYNLDYINNFTTNKKNNIFIQKRTKTSEETLLKLKYDYNIVGENFSNTSYTDYFKNLFSCKYTICIDTVSWKNASQIIAESTICDSICLGSTNKLFGKMLIHDFCVVNSSEEAIEKINKIETDKSLYDMLINHTREVKKLLSINYRTFEL